MVVDGLLRLETPTTIGSSLLCSESLQLLKVKKKMHLL